MPTVDELFAEHRGRAIDVAYRIVGQLGEAEDAVQEAYLRLLQADLDAIDDVRGWLVTVTSRICLDRLRRHEHARRAYVGPWLPEPLVEADGMAPDERVTLDDSVRMALLVVLQQLTPAERTSFLLHDVFDLPFSQIADVVGRSEQACRQLASRARRRIAADPHAAPRPVDPAEAAEVVEHFRAACEAGDLAGLTAVLSDGTLGDFDSGGTIPGAPTTELEGAEPVARQLLDALGGRGARFTTADVNGHPGVLVHLADRLITVIAVGVRDGKVDSLHGIGNPAKLAHLR